MRWSLMLVLALVACRGQAERSTAAATSSPPPTPPDAPALELPPMPPYPEAGRGRLVAQSAGPAGTEEIKGDWAARAGTCEQPAMLQVVAQEPGTGTILLLALPAGDRVDSYPVTTVSSGLPTPPAAQVAVQLFRRTGTFAYQAMEGSVDLYAFEKVASGRFAVTLREITTNTRLLYAGAFREIPVERLDAERCALATQGVGPGR
ncbi:MAG: hypothetical protein HY560_12535 [Gemmatimonadetes bacterium]|nr:hypothetical protein [Gemmatimonadota bacterium]